MKQTFQDSAGHERAIYKTTELGVGGVPFPSYWLDETPEVTRGRGMGIVDSDSAGRGASSQEFFWQAPVPSDEDKAEQDVRDTEALLRAERLAGRFYDDLKSARSEDEKYQYVRRYMFDRREAILDDMPVVSNAERIALVSFNALRDAMFSTRSVYTKRLVEWSLLREVHEVIDPSFFEVDNDKSNQVALKRWHEDDSFLPSDTTTGLVWKFTTDTDQYLDEHPEAQDMYEFAREAFTEYPYLGDVDFYAPDPYLAMDIDIKSIQADAGIPDGEVELAIETAKLFGVEISEINSESRKQLFHTGVNLDRDAYDRLVDIVAHTPKDGRVEFAEAFLATEFGDDFGDVLIDLAENMSSAELAPLLEKVQSVRDQSHRYADQFAEFDAELAGDVRRAAAERITEALYVAREIATSDAHQASARVLGGRITVSSYAEVIRMLDLTEKGLAKYNAAVDSRVARVAYESDSSTGVHLGENRDVLVQCKPYGTPKGEYQKGVEHSEEGQYNCSVNVLGDEEVPYEIRDYRRRYALSIRLDLEGVVRDENGGKVDFDATRDQLTVSLDLGSLRGAPDNPNTQVARVVALGNKLRRRALRQGRSRGYHTPLASRYGEKEQFASMVAYMYERLTGETLPIPLGAARFGRSVLGLPASPGEKSAA